MCVKYPTRQVSDPDENPLQAEMARELLSEVQVGLPLPLGVCMNAAVGGHDAPASNAPHIAGPEDRFHRRSATQHACALATTDFPAGVRPLDRVAALRIVERASSRSRYGKRTPWRAGVRTYTSAQEVGDAPLLPGRSPEKAELCTHKLSAA